MNDLLDSVFALDGLGFGAEGVALRWAHPLPAWGWTLVVVVAVALSAWSYRGLTGPRWTRTILASVRALVLVLLVLVFCGPRLERDRVSVQADRVVMLVDRSASMSLRDAPDATTAQPITRDESTRRAIEANAAVWRSLAHEKSVRWLGFDGRAYPLATRDSVPEFADPAGRRTALGAAIDGALRDSAGAPVSGLVVFSDGRSSDEVSRETLRRLEMDRVPVFVVPVGSREAPTDYAVARVEAPTQAFVDDTIPVRARVERRGAPGPAGVAELIDRATGAVLDSAPIDPNADSAEITLHHTPTDAGALSLEVRVRPGGPDLVADNNAQNLKIELVDRPLRVLYLEGYPRWEQRYLKNLLMREHSIASSNLILSSTRRYLQEGDVVIDRLPASPGEWGAYDLIIIGDVRADLLAPEQLEQIRDLVADRGAGLLWIGGEGATPATWAGTALADLLPFTVGAGGAGLPAWPEPVVIARTPIAERLGVLTIADDGSWPARLSDPATGWSLLRWAQRINPARLKPTAEALANAVPESDAPGGTGDPVVLSMRYGAGRVVYVGTDEIWRWRYGRGEDLPERFWLPIVRLLGRASLARTGAGATLTTDPSEATTGRAVQVRLDLFDQELLDSAPPTMHARVTRAGAEPTDLTLTRAGLSGARARYDATWAADEPGRYTVELAEPMLASFDLSASVEVSWPDDELRAPETDHPALERLAQRTGGAVLSPADLARLPEFLPNRELVIAGEPEVATLWDRPIVLALLILLLTAEWVGRRLVHLA